MYWYRNMPQYQTFEDIKRRKSVSAMLRRFFVEFVFLTFLIGVAFFIFSGFNYIDVRDQCFIKIKYDVLQGDRDSIFDALKVIKETDYIFYRNLCRNVDRIYEKRCVLANDGGRKLEYLKTKGCYIKGSRVILINPIDKNKYDKVEKRVEAIKLYAQMAIDYWAANPQTE